MGKVVRFREDLNEIHYLFDEDGSIQKVRNGNIWMICAIDRARFYNTRFKNVEREMELSINKTVE